MASVDKAEIADTMTWMLRKAFARLELPFVRMARYPGAARSVFLFRVDVDGLFGRNCRTIAELAERHGIRASFYFNGSLCRAHPGDLSSTWLASHEVAHHADTHDLFDDVEENKRNLLAGMAWVEDQLGVRATGYVAPRGLWNQALDKAIAEASVRSIRRTSAPHFDFLPVLSCCSVRSARESISPHADTHSEDLALASTSHAVLHHYVAALERQVALRRPAHLCYGHPEVLGRMATRRCCRALFDAVARRLGLPNMTVADFAALVDRAGQDGT